MSDTGIGLDAVMTVSVDGAYFGVLIDQVDRITMARSLAPVPDTEPEHLGLLEHEGELVPVMTLRPRAKRDEEMVLILKVRGHAVGLPIDGPGRVHNAWQTAPTDGEEMNNAVAGALACRAQDQSFWLVDADTLWSESQVA
ncbi:MAG: chemotaxis protein CheW [Myxococcota bacterium]